MVGQNIGKYRVLDRVGRGGMGTVYRAIDETLHREVAIKVLNAELNDPDVARRFRAEAITVARLSHPGIATIYELFQHDGQWLMVMEFVRGETLERVVAAHGTLAPERAARLCMQSLAALAHAHSMGVVHRDLKPANIMLTDGGDIKIMDFGIARVTGTEHLTNVGFMMGTPAYMAPEQVLGQEIDARADLYAMGVVLFRLLSGQLPFKGDSPFAMAQAQVNAEPTPVATLREGLPAWVEDVLERALQKKPNERFQSAAEFHDTLDRSLSGDPTPEAYRSSAPSNLVSTPSKAMRTLAGTQQAASTSSGAIARDTPTTLSTSPVPAAASATPFDPASVAPTIAAATPAMLERPPITPAASSADEHAAVPTPPAAPLPPPAVSTGSVETPRRPIGIWAAVGAVVVLLAGGAWWMVSSPKVVEPAVEEVASPAEPDPLVEVEAPEVDTPVASASPGANRANPPAVETAARPADERPAGASGSTAAESSAGTLPPRTVEPPKPVVPPVEVTNVKVMIVDGRKAEDEDVTLTFDDARVVVTGLRSGGALATMPYNRIAVATYVRGRSPRWDVSLASPPNNLDVGGMFRTSRHWLMLQGSDSYLLFRLEDINVIRTIRELETRTGLTVQRP